MIGLGCLGEIQCEAMSPCGTSIPEPAIDALAAGKPVILEKPIASAVEDAEKIATAS